jgi:hypothetical protein
MHKIPFQNGISSKMSLSKETEITVLKGEARMQADNWLLWKIIDVSSQFHNISYS